MQEVELHQAWLWTCENCGRDNFARSITVEFDSVEEKEEAFRAVYHLDPFEELPESWDQCDCVTCPERVECDFCEAVFKTLGPGGPCDEQAGDD